MANNNYSKKRRLDSEISYTSGMSVLSNITRSTDLTNDSDESQGDYTDPNSSGPVTNSRFDFTATNTPHNAQTMVKNNIPPRHRQISFNLNDEDVDDKGHVQGQRSAVFGPPYHHYDNRKPYMLPRYRVRRATESCIQNIEHEMEDLKTHLLRSNTTAEFRHQQLDQNRLTEQLVQDFDANKRAKCVKKNISMQGRSQSVTSLRNGDHIYTSLQPEVSRNTLVKIPNNNSYIHPVTQLAPTTNDPNSPHRLDYSADNASQTSSRYLRVESEFTPQPVPPNRCCREKSFRKGFYLLLLLNIIFILLNVFGLPFAYVTIQEHWNSKDTQLCITCDSKNMKTKDLETFGIQINEEGNCCLPQLDDFINGVSKKMERSKIVFRPSNETVINTPILQLRSESISEKVLLWKKNPDLKLHYQSDMDGNSSHIKIPINGYYYIYTRVMFKINKQDVHGKCVLGHHVQKFDHDNKSFHKIDSYEEKCANATIINHSSHLEFVQYLKKGDLLFIELLKEKAELKSEQPSVFGMFLLSE